MTTRVAFHWSGGKDSALALSRLLAREDVVVDRLVTTVDDEGGASTVHGLPVELLEAQAESLGLPLQAAVVGGPGMAGYREAMDMVAARLRDEGVDAVAFGDLSRSGALGHRQEQFGSFGLDVLEPLWGLSSGQCLEELLASGIRAVTVVVDAAVLGPEHLGVEVDRAFVDALPDGVDPCGELGEYHTFAHDGPLFTRPVDYSTSPVHGLERTIGTTEGRRTYAYWLATPQVPVG